MDAAKVLREADAIVEACFAITNFDMPETMRNFEKHHITAYQLLPFAFIVEKAEKLGLIDANEKEQIDAWLDTPWTWQLSAVCLLKLLKTNQFPLTENGRPRNLPFFMCERLIH